MRLPSLLIVASLLLQSWAWADVQSSSRQYGYFPSASPDLGKGFDIADPHRDFPSCLSSFKRVPLFGGPVNQRTKADASIIKGTRELRNALKIDAKMDASVLIFNANTSFTYDTSADLNEQNINVIIHADSDFGGETLEFADPTTYRSGGGKFLGPQELLASGRMREFTEMCGPELVSTLYKGASIVLVISISGLTSTQATTMDLRVGGGASIKKLSASAEHHVNLILRGSYSGVSASLSAYVRGGTGIASLAKSVDSLVSAESKSISGLSLGVDEALKALKPDMGAVVGFTTVSFPGVNNNFEDLLNESKLTRLGKIVTVYRERDRKFKFLNDLYFRNEHLDQKPEEFKNIWQGLLVRAREELPRLESHLAELARIHHACLLATGDGSEACRLPEKPEIYNLEMVYALITDI